MQKNGVPLPQPRPGGGAGFLGGGATLPKGVTSAQYAAALRKCATPGRFGGGTAAGRFSSPAFRQALAKYAECLRQNGVNVPAPDTSGKGPVFDTKGVNTTSPQFRAATVKCRSTLSQALRNLRRGAGASGAGGSTPGG